nr:PREDICTED: uncharacterized protein LOC106705075 [Latimeria chalumnae]|eukprot:XP_014349150.1 PREDICTED: uncharacterized protein LOC106705075 [Latimeria chalumnae]
MDPSVAPLLFNSELEALLNAAKAFIKCQAAVDSPDDPVQNNDESSSSAVPITLKQFKFLAKNVGHPEQDQQQGVVKVTWRSILECKDYRDMNVLTVWLTRETIYPRISNLGQDLVVAPASQAYVEPIFSVWDELTARKRNTTTATLETEPQSFEGSARYRKRST